MCIRDRYNGKNGLPRGPPFVYTKERRLDPNHTIFENSTPKYTYSQNISQFCDLACSTFCMVLHGFLMDSLLNKGILFEITRMQLVNRRIAALFYASVVKVLKVRPVVCRKNNFIVRLVQLEL